MLWLVALSRFFGCRGGPHLLQVHKYQYARIWRESDQSFGRYQALNRFSMQLRLCLKPLIFNNYLYGIYPSIKGWAQHLISIRHVDTSLAQISSKQYADSLADGFGLPCGDPKRS
jgi:hypothetical protein